MFGAWRTGGVSRASHLSLGALSQAQTESCPDFFPSTDFNNTSTASGSFSGFKIQAKLKAKHVKARVTKVYQITSFQCLYFIKLYPKGVQLFTPNELMNQEALQDFGSVFRFAFPGSDIRELPF